MGAGMSHRSNAHMYSLRRRVVGPAVHRAIPHIVISDIAVVHTYGSRSGVHTRVASEAVPAQHVANEMLLYFTISHIRPNMCQAKHVPWGATCILIFHAEGIFFALSSGIS
jgi:hypothetical protein